LRAPRVTLKDIARASGVDISTVSRSLSGSYGINKVTRDRIAAVAAQLNYHPSRVSRGNATERSFTIGLIVSDVRNPFFADLVRGAADAASAAGYEVILCNSDVDAAKKIRHVQSLLAKRVEGLLMNSVIGLDRTEQERLTVSGPPVVLLNRPPTHSNFSTVTANNEEGGYIAGKYLIARGHQDIEHITGARDRGNFRDRVRGFTRACAATEESRTPVILYGDDSFIGGYDLMRLILARHSEITAIFAANDAMAFGALRACEEAGLQVPRDMSILGFDNVDLCAVVRPPLTIIHQPKYEMGRAAVEMILRALEKKAPYVPEHRQFGVTLVERESCSFPNADSLARKRVHVDVASM
jgi:LacI family transcriptional regulator